MEGKYGAGLSTEGNWPAVVCSATPVREGAAFLIYIDNAENGNRSNAVQTSKSNAPLLPHALINDQNKRDDAQNYK